MKLITEHIEEAEHLIIEDTGTGRKNHYISGIFAQAEQLNRNKRKYSRELMEREISRFQKMIENKQAMGELNHPTSPTINPERASHLIQELKWDGNNVIGKAKILESLPMGKIVAGLLEEGVKLGVSTRGMGSLKQMREGYSMVQPDYRLNTVDIVSDPSGQDCWVAGIMEGVEWLYDETSGMYRVAEESRTQMSGMTTRQIEEQKVDLFKQFLLAVGTN